MTTEADVKLPTRLMPAIGTESYWLDSDTGRMALTAFPGVYSRPQSEAILRRLAAAWNATIRVPIETLEMEYECHHVWFTPTSDAHIRQCAKCGFAQDITDIQEACEHTWRPRSGDEDILECMFCGFAKNSEDKANA